MNDLLIYIVLSVKKNMTRVLKVLRHFKENIELQIMFVWKNLYNF